MNNATQVSLLVAGLKDMGLTRAEIAVHTAEACMDWPYVWGGNGQKCTPANRRIYANRDACPAAEAAVIRSRCKALSGNGSCMGCKWYPEQKTVLFFDCRGFTYWALKQAGITISGAGATSQFNTDTNWTEKGKIGDMPDVVCCVFQQSAGRMQHTGLHVGGGRIIHCSGCVKEAKTTDKGWTHYAIPKGIMEAVPVADKPTLRKGSKGEYVTLMQTKLIQLGYDLDPYGADGDFGNKTQRAVVQFQRDSGLTGDGVVGAKTWEALESGKATTYTVTIRGVSRTVADGIISKYGGTMTAEGE